MGYSFPLENLAGPLRPHSSCHIPALPLPNGPHSRDATAEGPALRPRPIRAVCGETQEEQGLRPCWECPVPTAHVSEFQRQVGVPPQVLADGGCRRAARAMFHTTPIPNRCAQHRRSIWCRFLLPPGRGINGGMRKSWVISPKGREQCGTDKNVCRV